MFYPSRLKPDFSVGAAKAKNKALLMEIDNEWKMET